MATQKVSWRALLAAATIVGSLSAMAENEQSGTSDAALSQCIEEADISGPGPGRLLRKSAQQVVMRW